MRLEFDVLDSKEIKHTTIIDVVKINVASKGLSYWLKDKPAAMFYIPLYRIDNVRIYEK